MTATPIPPLVTLSFFYDMNLNGRHDSDETVLQELDIVSDGYCQILPDGSVMVPRGTTVNLTVSGTAPNGKQLLSATFLEPYEVVMLPRFTYEVGMADTLMGLSDGFCSAAIRPDQLNWDSYDDVLANPELFTNQLKELRLYPPYAPTADAQPNWFFYGYYVEQNPWVKHLAFDVWAVQGTPVHAPVPGGIVKGNYDHIVGIRGPYGQFDLNHLVPSVQQGDTVKRGDVVGALDFLGHVHMEVYTPHDAQTGNPLILSCFPGLTPDDILVSPLDGQPVPVLPYFGP